MPCENLISGENIKRAYRTASQPQVLLENRGRNSNEFKSGFVWTAVGWKIIRVLYTRKHKYPEILVRCRCKSNDHWNFSKYGFNLMFFNGSSCSWCKCERFIRKRNGWQKSIIHIFSNFEIGDHAQCQTWVGNTFIDAIFGFRSEVSTMLNFIAWSIVTYGQTKVMILPAKSFIVVASLLLWAKNSVTQSNRNRLIKISLRCKYSICLS